MGGTEGAAIGLRQMEMHTRSPFPRSPRPPREVREDPILVGARVKMLLNVWDVHFVSLALCFGECYDRPAGNVIRHEAVSY